MPHEERPTPPASSSVQPAVPVAAAVPESNKGGWLDSSLDLQQGLVVTEGDDLNLFQLWTKAFLNIGRH